MHTTRFTRLALAAGAIALAACAQDKSGTNDGATSDSASGNVSQNSATAQPAAPTDADIVAYLDVANVSDSAGGKLASTKATNADVKAFGRQMMGDHHTLRVAGQNFAKGQNITPNPAGGDSTQQKAQSEMSALDQQAKGAAWDKAYIDHEVQMHEQVLANAKAAHDQTQNAELKALIEKATPTIQAHLDKARSIQQKLTPTT